MSDWIFDGGPMCVDLLNTLRDRMSGGRELLTGPAALTAWLRMAGFEQVRRATTADVERAIAVREAIDRLLAAIAEERRPAAADVRMLNAATATTPPPTPRLRIDTEGAPHKEFSRPDDPVASAFAILAADAIDLAAARPALRVCAAENCGLRFVDVSPKSNRQWCSMSRCGNRAKARAAYARRIRP